VDLSHDQVADLRRAHPAWRLLSAENSPLILSFLAEAFPDAATRATSSDVLIERLENHLLQLRHRDTEAYPRTAAAYLSDWGEPSRGWLRRTYPNGVDEAHYEPTPAVETALAFLRSLGPRETIGTATRLSTIRDLARQIVAGAATDPDQRRATLLSQRAEIDAQIAALDRGEGAVLDEAAIRERYEEILTTARALMADMRAVEERFRVLARKVHQESTTWERPRGELLESVFGLNSQIASSDQGRSWEAFWSHLLSSEKKAELRQMLTTMETIPVLQGRTEELDDLLQWDLFRAAQSIQEVVSTLSAQLRRFLDEAVLTENRRISGVLREALAASLSTVGDPRTKALALELTDVRASVSLPLERPLYVEPAESELDSQSVQVGQFDPQALSVLSGLSYLDLPRLETAITTSLAHRGGRATVAEIVADHPLRDGLPELVGYLYLALEREAMQTGEREDISWVDDAGRNLSINVPQVLFSVLTQPPGESHPVPAPREVEVGSR
jgi:hypothetical protein